MSATVGFTRTAVKATAAAVDAVHRPPPGLVVLIYHRVGQRTPVEVDLPTALFAEQMRQPRPPHPGGHAERRSRRARAGRGRRSGRAPGRGHVRRRHRRLRRGRAPGDASNTTCPSTLYVATDFVDRGIPFPDDGVAITWSALGDAVATGLVDIGSHTHHHALLDRLPAADVDVELDRSIELIGERLGVTALHFAYPKAVMGSAEADPRGAGPVRLAPRSRTRA